MNETRDTALAAIYGAMELSDEEFYKTSEQLLRIARIHRNRAELLRRIGEKDYNVEMADCLWGVYQMLGKLCPTVYVVEKG